MKELLQEHCFFVLNETDAGELLLEVECGTTAVFTVRIRLTDNERALFQSTSAQSIRRLAEDIRDRPDDYLHRKIG